MEHRSNFVSRHSLVAARLNLILAVVAVLHPGAQAAAQTFADFLVGGLHRATGAAFAPGETGRIFVTEQFTGNIRLVDLVNRTLQPTPVLHRDVAFAGPEQGLLGLAFDPDFATNGYFYLNYTPPDDDTHIVRFRMVGDPRTSTVADPDSAHTLLIIEQPQVNHNGGWTAFGPDGYLYIGMGDGGNGLDFGPGHTPETGNAQDLTDNLLGKILRIDVKGDDFPADPLRNYAIPQTNPFVDKEGDDEIWAFGLRNPWRASFDRLTGDLWIGDVGESTREEINYLPADHPGGANFGWRLREGTIATPNQTVGGPRPPGAIDPVYDYPHPHPETELTGGAVTGGFIYRGPVAAFQGLYFFNDTNFPAKIWTLDPDAVDIPASVMSLHGKLPRSYDGIFLGQVPSWAEDAAGNLYAVQLDANGGVFRVATHSQDAVWNGNDAAAGAPGDGQSWSQAANWTRGAAADTQIVAEDHVFFVSGSMQPVIKLEAERLVSAATFNAPYTLQQGTLRILSGNLAVAEDVTATIESELMAETEHRSIRKLGLGTLLIQGSAGQTVVKEGTLGGTGTLDHLTVREGGTVAPGNAIGILTVDHSFTMHDGARLEIQLGGTDNSNPLDPQYDELVVGGPLVAAGALDVSLFDRGAGTFEPVNGEFFSILSSVDEITGSFADVDLPDLAGGLVWEIDTSDSQQLVLRVVALLDGDYNADGSVDAADYVVWRNSVDETGRGLAADGTGAGGLPDGVVNDADYQLWRANFGRTIPPLDVAAAANVPEPYTVFIAAFGVLLALIRRRGGKESTAIARRIARG
jgi:glucose/arabinose dehydrogenase